MSSEFGHEARKTKRQENLKTDIKNAAIIIQDEWKSKTYTPENIIDFYELVDGIFRAKLKTSKGYIKGREQLYQHIRTINSAESNKFPVPMVPIYIERAQPVKGLNWLTEGRKIANLTKLAMEYWSTPRTYTPEEVLGWTLLSAILWGGLNDQAVLRDLLNALIEKRPLRPFLKYLVIIPLDAKDPSYGNYFDDKVLKRSFSFIPDDVSRCWIAKFYKESFDATAKPTVENLLNDVLKQLSSDIRIFANKSNQHLLKYANFHWEQIPEVRIDQAISRVLTQDQKCCSLSVFEFANFYSPYIHADRNLHLDNNLLFQRDFSKFESGQKKTTLDHAVSHVTSDIRKALATIFPSSELKVLESKQNNESSKRLVAWLCELAESGDLQSSSIERYMDAVAQPWLIQTFEDHLGDYDEEDFEILYQDIIEAKTEKGSANDAWLLQRFHNFQVEHYGAPEVNLKITRSQQICSASILSPRVFQAMCDAITKATGWNQHEKKTCLLILILAFRTGMRRGEITGLIFNDVEWGVELSFLVHDNKIRKVKTSSAYRRVPVWALLKPEEFKLLNSYLEESWKASKNKNAAVFSLANSTIALRKGLPSDLFKLAINQVLVKHSYSFHSLRHTAISNWALILIARQELIEHLTDYHVEDCERIRTALLGHQHQGQDKWFALAQVAGHLTPDHSFQHYIHFAHLMGGYELCQGKVEMPYAALQNILGYTKRKISSKTSDAFDRNYEFVSLSHIRPLLAQSLASSTQEWRDLLPQSPKSTPSSSNTEPEQNQTDDNGFILPGAESSLITMQMVHLVLSKLEKGKTIEEVTLGYPIDVDIAKNWFERAHKLAGLKTQQGKFKLFTDARKNTRKAETGKEADDNDLLLVPTKPQSPHEQIHLAKFFMNACDIHYNDREGLHQFLDIFFDRVSTSKGVIRFSLKEKDKLAAFLRIGENLIDINLWKLRAPTFDEASQLKTDYKLNSKLAIVETRSGSTSEDSDKKSNTYMGYSLSVIHPNKKDIQDQNSTSFLLKYGCHMIAIADLSYQIKSGESIAKSNSILIV